MLGEEGERALDEAGDGCCSLVLVELDVGEPGVVVDDRVRVVVADPCLVTHPVAVALGAVAGRAVTRLQEAGERLTRAAAASDAADSSGRLAR